MCSSKLICENCKKEFELYISNKRDNHVFCSLECCWQWKRGKKWEEIRTKESIYFNKNRLRDRWKLNKNPQWKGGVSSETYRQIVFNIYKKPKICERCGSKNFVDIHHKDRNYQNISQENLEVICRRCHNKEHKR